MDMESDTGHVPHRVVLLRAGMFFGWLLASWPRWRAIGADPDDRRCS